MADQVSKTLATLAWILIGVIGVVVSAGLIYLLAIFFAAAISVWIKLLVFVGLTGFALLVIVVIRDRVKEAKTDKYKDIEV
ncbi:MAG: hypothetical protein F4W90_08150 [Gammaproteobacteria bacterium]|nr:hypothetical protein [Gammaproteobacteria bacterium]